MRITSILLSLLAVAAMSAGNANAASTNLVKNGDFTQVTNGNNNQVGHVAGVTGETLLSDWTSYDGNNGGYNFVLNGGQVTSAASAISLQSFTSQTNGGNFFASDPLYHAGVLSQSISGLTVGGTYTLTFDYALGQQSGFTGANTDYWQVLFGGTAKAHDLEVGVLPANTVSKNSAALSIATGGFSGWQTSTMTFTAAEATQVLSFFAQGSAGAPPFLLLDNVSLTAAVPEPSTWGMMLGGMGLVGFMARRRRAAKRA
ncbi:PEPxxWA-CTERM sorting domain-containing protein [Pseudoduganella sp. FT26W]|uniref:PEPxxWA-CTERM sorting domain-containing protein n=1 Tax=Duganella aquatilis TaxID=2666082 RepID=A0A844CZP5_9BURK|nr:PEPxxWA-CTERM sorting domain-containing protein [Duganella aquatilis]MRW86287.1 PEPxxWA-CTERM sorting domain-containing protein [Duganella aquatilis]